MRALTDYSSHELMFGLKGALVPVGIVAFFFAPGGSHVLEERGALSFYSRSYCC